MSKIIDYKLQAKNLFSKVQQCSHQINVAWENEREVNVRIEQETPTLMFYGVYNAGKSTLLNAIIGKEVASMADVPETHQVTPYEWNGYKLFDTPGINGPEKDYVLSRSELVKHNIILFLVDDSDSFDSKIVSEEIVQIIESGKPLILVMNNKQTIDGENDENGVAKRGKLYQNISKVAQERGISRVEDKFSFIMIDADTALTARLQNKKLLLESSALEELEDLILHTLKSQEGFKFLMPPLMMMEQQVKKIQAHLSQNLKNQDEVELNKLINDLRDRRTDLLSLLKMKINSKLEVTKSLVLQKLMNGEAVETDLEQANTEIKQMLQVELEQAIDYAAVDISSFATKLNIESNYQQLNEGSHVAVAPKLSTIEQMPNATVDVVQTVMQNSILAKGAEQILAKTILPKIISAPIPIVNVLLVAKTIFDVISIIDKQKREKEREKEQLNAQVAAANAQQEEALYKRQQAIQHLKSQLDVEFYRMNEEILRNIDQTIKETFAQYISQLENELQMVKSVSETIYKQLNEVTLLHENINEMKIQLSM